MITWPSWAGVGTLLQFSTRAWCTRCWLFSAEMPRGTTAPSPGTLPACLSCCLLDRYLRASFPHAVRPRGRQSQQRTYQAATYAINVAEHVNRHRVIAAKRYVTWVLEAAGLAPADARGTAGR